MKPTKKDIEILKHGTFMQKQLLGIDHHGDIEWMDEAMKYLKKED